MQSKILILLLVIMLGLSPVRAAASEVAADFDINDPFDLTSQWDRPERVPGVAGDAWRSDGFSSYLTVPARFEGERFIGAAMWVALESYPSDREAPTAEIMRSSFLQQSDSRRGFDLWVDTYGRWGATLAASSKRIDLRADAAFPLYRWSHVAFSYDPETGEASLFLDRRRVATQPLGGTAPWLPAQTALTVARPYRTAGMLNFEVNLLNGAFDDIIVTQDPGRWRRVLRGARRRLRPPSPRWPFRPAVSRRIFCGRVITRCRQPTGRTSRTALFSSMVDIISSISVRPTGPSRPRWSGDICRAPTWSTGPIIATRCGLRCRPTPSGST